MTSQEFCIFCRQNIIDSLVRCPYCNTAAHREELQRWILKFGKCPRCERELKPYVR